MGIHIRQFVRGDAEAVERMVLASFREFVAQDCTEEGVKNFEAFASSSNLVALSQTAESYVAEKNGRIVGVVGRVKDRIRYLFVDKECHGQGIASALLKKSEEQALEHGYVKLLVRSSLYAQEFYRKQGYKKSTGTIRCQGIVFQPMVKSIS